MPLLLKLPATLLTLTNRIGKPGRCGSESFEADR
jgi:hypothetical protein